MNKTIGILVIALLQSHSGWAALGHAENNGGQLVETPSGSQVADLHYDRSGDSYTTTIMKLDDYPGLSDGLRTIQTLLDRYGAVTDDFWDNQVFSQPSPYRYVSKLECDDPMPLNDSHLESSAKTYACTSDGITYVLKSVFDELPTDQMALALFHERLHVLGFQHNLISPVIATVAWMQAKQAAQLAGDRAPLTHAERSKFDDLYAATSGMAILPDAMKDVEFQKHITPGGGFVYITAWMDDITGFMGIGSLIQAYGATKVSVSSDSVLIGCFLYANPQDFAYGINDDAGEITLESSDCENTEIRAGGAHFKVTGSTLKDSTLLGSGIEIKNARCQDCDLRASQDGSAPLKIEEGSDLDQVSLHTDYSYDGFVVVRDATLEIRGTQKVKNLDVQYSGKIVLDTQSRDGADFSSVPACSYPGPTSDGVYTAEHAADFWLAPLVVTPVLDLLFPPTHTIRSLPDLKDCKPL